MRVARQTQAGAARRALNSLRAPGNSTTPMIKSATRHQIAGASFGFQRLAASASVNTRGKNIQGVGSVLRSTALHI